MKLNLVNYFPETLQEDSIYFKRTTEGKLEIKVTNTRNQEAYILDTHKALDKTWTVSILNPNLVKDIEDNGTYAVDKAVTDWISSSKSGTVTLHNFYKLVNGKSERTKLFIGSCFGDNKLYFKRVVNGVANNWVRTNEIKAGYILPISKGGLGANNTVGALKNLNIILGKVDSTTDEQSYLNLINSTLDRDFGWFRQDNSSGFVYAYGASFFQKTTKGDRFYRASIISLYNKLKGNTSQIIETDLNNNFLRNSFNQIHAIDNNNFEGKDINIVLNKEFKTNFNFITSNRILNIVGFKHKNNPLLAEILIKIPILNYVAKLKISHGVNNGHLEGYVNYELLSAGSDLSKIPDRLTFLNYGINCPYEFLFEFPNTATGTYEIIKTFTTFLGTRNSFNNLVVTNFERSDTLGTPSYDLSNGGAKYYRTTIMINKNNSPLKELKWNLKSSNYIGITQENVKQQFSVDYPKTPIY